MTRDFSVRAAQRERVPLMICLSGASGTGKTWSALELATGMKEVEEGPIVVIDTENRRALHYADQFDFEHMDFQPPFKSLDYLAALEQAAALKPSCVIIDSMSHEHEGIGGMLDFHGNEVDKKIKNARARGDTRPDYKLQDTYQMLAWREPKKARQDLLNGIVRLNINLILCFRAAEKNKPEKKGNKTEIVNQGFKPIGADKFIWEAQLAAILYPGQRGIPHFQSTMPGEQHVAKIQGAFEKMFGSNEQLSRVHGKRLAEWARGGSEPEKKAEALDISALSVEGEHAAGLGMSFLTAFWKRIPPIAQKELKLTLDEDWKPMAIEADGKNDEGNDAGDIEEGPPGDNPTPAEAEENLS